MDKVIPSRFKSKCCIGWLGCSIGCLGCGIKFRVLCCDIELGRGAHRDNGSACCDGRRGECLVVGCSDEVVVLFPSFIFSL